MNIEAQWTVELNVNCPACDHYYDLLSSADGNGDWESFRDLEVPEHDTDRSKNIEVTCPKCGHEFMVDCVW